LGNTPLEFIRSASTVPAAALDRDQRERVKGEFSRDRPIVCFFGFANPNKGVERLFDVADPAAHHLVLLCDLDPANPYHATILQASREAPWAGHVTVTGYQPASRVAECLAVADAALFPFPDGAGEWSSSLQAAEAAGVFSLATTDDRSQIGDHAGRNVYFCWRDRTSDMRDALVRHLGRRIAPQTAVPWSDIASAHEGVYRSVCHETRAR
jgi:glycosyltransferase involved in cell wall biosynthesis